MTGRFAGCRWDGSDALAEDIGAVVAFLISADGAFITGQTIMVDGGMGVFR